MSKESKIQWTDATWNIARGCDKVDADCKYCYMYRDSLNGTRYVPNTVVRTKTVFDLPLRLKEPKKIFTCSLTDFFHEGCDSFRGEAWEIIRRCPQHIFQILTKRPERIKANLPEFWSEIEGRVWLGTSVGSQAGIGRAVELAKLEVNSIKFLSLEPLHGPIDLTYPKEMFPDGPTFCCSGRECGCFGLPEEYPMLSFFDWIIVGGESGNENGKYRYRPCSLEWIERIVSDSKRLDVPVFVKQMGTYLSKELKMTDRHGGNIEEFPKHLQIREFPKRVS